MSDELHMTREIPARVGCRPIRDADIGPVIELLREGFPTRTAANWVRALDRLSRRDVPEPYPRFGYLLEADGRPVGVVLLIFSASGNVSKSPNASAPASANASASVNGSAPVNASAQASASAHAQAMQIRCNISSWYVRDFYRGYASLLSKAAVRHKNVTYINISPALQTWPTIEAQGFTRYTFGQIVAVPALGPRVGNSCVREFDAAEDYGPTLSVEERDMLATHLGYGCLAYVVMENGKANPFIFLPRRINRRIVPALQLVYCRDVRDFVRLSGPIGRALARRGRLLVCLDAPGPLPGLVGRYFPDRGYPRFFKGSDRPRIGDLTYSELVLFP